MEKRTIAQSRMREVLSDYAGSRKEFFKANMIVEKADKLIDRLALKDLPLDDDVDRDSNASFISLAEVGSQPQTFYSSASAQSSTSW